MLVHYAYGNLIIGCIVFLVSFVVFIDSEPINFFILLFLIFFFYYLSVCLLFIYLLFYLNK